MAEVRQVDRRDERKMADEPGAAEVGQSRDSYVQNGQGRASLDPGVWQGSYNGRESTLQQLAPYVGKMKSGMAGALIQEFSEPGHTVLDPFCGSGVIPLECALLGRRAWANDLSRYAHALTRGKLEAPASLDVAVERAVDAVDKIEEEAPKVDVSSVPEWVRDFFHPRTLREVVAAFRVLRDRRDFFLLACLLGILHHQRPGFLSYPASHLVPYLRTQKYPSDEHPEMYGYRDLRSRLVAKVRRAYRRPRLPSDWDKRDYAVWSSNAMHLPIESETADCIVSSPPYFGALDYARDNRLRLWFLGCEDWKDLDDRLIGGRDVYLREMSVCLAEMHRVLRKGGHCVLVVGDVRRNGATIRTAEMLAEAASECTGGGFVVQSIYSDPIPAKRRSRRRTRTTKVERILVMRKEGGGSGGQI